MNLDNKVKYQKLKEDFNIIKLEFENLSQDMDDLCNELKESVIIDKKYYENDNLSEITKSTNIIVDEINTSLLSRINSNL